jgi:C4-dicarboxylate transporter, DctQ subunit
VGIKSGSGEEVMDHRGKLGQFFDNIERYLVVIFYSYFTMIIVVEVFRRFALNVSSQWGEETARYAFVYMTYIGAAAAIKTRSHLKIDILQSRMGPKGLFASYLLTDVCFIILAVLVIRFSIKVAHFQWTTETMMQGLDWNLAYAQAAIPIGWSLMLIRLVQRLAATAREFRSGQLRYRAAGGMLDES